MLKFIITLFTFCMFLVVGKALANQQKEIRVDNDVGISIPDNTFISTNIEFEILFITCRNEAEVEISPGDQFVNVSSTIKAYKGNETLQVSYMINNPLEYKINNIEKNNRHVVTTILCYDIQNKPYLSKDRFRLDRSRCYLQTRNIEWIQNA